MAVGIRWAPNVNVSQIA